MARFVVIKPFRVGDGFMNDRDGKLVPMQSLVPQPHQIISGRIETRRIGGKSITGVPFNVLTKINGKLENATFMIPQEHLEIQEEEKVIAPATAPAVVEGVKDNNKVDVVVPSKNTETETKVEVSEHEEEAPIFDLIGSLFN